VAYTNHNRISDGAHMQPYLEGGNMVYQAAFVGPKALATLVVEEVTKHTPKSKDRWCPGCQIM